MYKVLIIDDESLIIKSLVTSIEWNKYGLEVVGEANDGVEGYKQIIELAPDIVFTDIRMPGMSGLELIKKVNETPNNILFIVISGYAEFEYAQKALSYEAIGYCLKPFDYTEIAGILGKAREMLERRKSLLESRLLSLIGDDSSDAKTEREEIIKGLGFAQDVQKGIVVLATVGAGCLDMPQSVDVVKIKAGSNKNAYLLQYDSLAFVKEQLGGGYYQSVNGIGVSNVRYSFDFIGEAVEEAYTAAYQYFMKGKKEIYEYNIFKFEDLNKTFLRLEDILGKKDIPQVQKLLDYMVKIFSTGNYSIKHAYQLYNIIMHSFYTSSPNKYDNYIFDYEQLTGLFSDVGSMISYLKQQLFEYTPAHKFESISSQAGNEYFRRILQYVNEKFYQDISLQKISEEFTINPSYVSQLFKKNTSRTFIEYLTDLRISYAKNLLKVSDLPVNEIAEKTGFKDYFYFTRVFKKVTGKTPTDYRISGI